MPLLFSQRNDSISTHSLSVTSSDAWFAMNVRFAHKGSFHNRSFREIWLRWGQASRPALLSNAENLTKS